MKSLLASLNDHPIALLRGIAELRGVALTSNARTDAAAQLAAALAEPSATFSTVAACSPAAQNAWAALTQAGGHMKIAVLVRSYGDIRPVGPGRLEARRPGASRKHRRGVWYRGLIFRTFADFGDGPLEYIYIPDDLQIPPDTGHPVAQAAPQCMTPVIPPPRSRQASNALAVDMCAILALLREMPAQLDKAGTLRQSDIARLQTVLLRPEDGGPRLDLLLTLARGQGWLKLDRGRLVLDTQAATAWLRATHWEQMTSLFQGWRDAANWNDLRQVPSLRAEGDWRSDPTLHAACGAGQPGRAGIRARGTPSPTWLRRSRPVTLIFSGRMATTPAGICATPPRGATSPASSRGMTSRGG